MLEKTLVVGPFQCNCRLFVCPQTGEAVLVDPGAEPERILAEVAQTTTAQGLPIRVKYLLHTHAHLDHIGATRGVREGSGAAEDSEKGSQQAPQIALHPDDEPMYLQLKMQGGLFNMHYDDPLPIDRYLADDEVLRVGKLKFTILHTPGHSPGSICLRLHEDSAAKIPEMLLSGDTLFRGTVGRTDLWGANQEQMLKSIRQRMLVLDDDTRVCPGHGPDTRIGIEKRTNPFLS